MFKIARKAIMAARMNTSFKVRTITVRRIRFLHTYFTLSDRQLEYGLRYNLAYKKFAGIPANYYSFDHSSREDFDSRIPVEVHKAIFFHILAQIIDLGLHNPKEQWIIDATHSLSWATHH
ncbi:transposase, partial [Candidatus Hakubella thermalkaliphila]